MSVEGSRDLPGQSGGLCSKGAASRQYVYNKDRILYPMKRIGKKGSGEFERISWDEAYRMIAENLLRIKKNMVRRRQHFMRISEMVQTGTSAACQCLRVSELLYGIQYLFSVGGNGMEIYLWK